MPWRAGCTVLRLCVYVRLGTVSFSNLDASISHREITICGCCMNPAYGVLHSVMNHPVETTVLLSM